jgi:hypothetical protein
MAKSVGKAIGSVGGAVSSVFGGSSGGIVGTVIGAGMQLFGASQSKSASDDMAKEMKRSAIAAATAQHAMSNAAIQTKLKLAKMSIFLERNQDRFLTKLRKVQLKQQASIVERRRRTEQQKLKTQGFGGSFTRVRTGHTELQAEVKRQKEQLSKEFALRQEQRELELYSASEEWRLGRRQASVTAAAGKTLASQAAAAAGTAADINFIGASANIGSSLVQNQAITEAIGGFFSNLGTTNVSSGSSPLVTSSNPMGLTSGQGL